jgi:uncharacterized protein YcnI
MSRRTIVAAGLAAGAVLWMASPAAAHVTVSSPSASQGGFGTLTFQVPNESDTASTNRLEVTLPEDAPLAFVSVKPVPGWTATVERRTLDEPMEVEGSEITEVASKITWEGGSIAPGQFEQFLVSAGPLPEDADSMMFPAIQTYDDGEVVRWIEETPEGGEEPEHPAPVLELAPPADEHGGEAASEETPATAPVAAEGDNAAAELSDVQDDADSAMTLAIVGIVVGVLGLVAGIGGLALGRRKAAGGAAR